MFFTWQTIDSAPRDNTLIIGWSKDEGEPYMTRWCNFYDGFGDSFYGWSSLDASELGPVLMTPTHWMEVPKPPNID